MLCRMLTKQGAEKDKNQEICRLRHLKHFLKTFACRKHVKNGILFESIHHIIGAMENKKSAFPPFQWIIDCDFHRVYSPGCRTFFQLQLNLVSE